jgi:hypothetical protein
MGRDFTRAQLEEALDSGRLWCLMRDGRWWKCRRNGRTQLWKTRPDEFRIPFKAGLKVYGGLTEAVTRDYFRISDENPSSPLR